MKCFVSYFRARVQFFRLSCIPPSLYRQTCFQKVDAPASYSCMRKQSNCCLMVDTHCSRHLSFCLCVCVCFSFCFCFFFQSRILKPDWGTEYLCVRKSQVTREVLSRDGILLNKFENLLIKWIEVRTNIITFVLTHNYSNYVQFNYFTFFLFLRFFPNSLN